MEGKYSLLNSEYRSEIPFNAHPGGLMHRFHRFVFPHVLFLL